MKIVIAGAGEVGTHLAKQLSKEEQDIVVIDENEAKLAPLEPYNLMTLTGNPTSFAALKSIGMETTDLFIAVTPHESRNFTACSIAKHLGAKRTVARIDSYEYLLPEQQHYFHTIGLDELIYPEVLAAKEIKSALRRSWVRNWFELCNGELIVVGVKIDRKTQITDMPLRDLAAHASNIHVAAIKHGHDTIIPRGDDVIIAGDIVYFASTPDNVDRIREICGKRQAEIKRVLIMGGSKIAVQIAKEMADDDYRIKIIEIDRERAHELSKQLPEVNIIHGDARDIALLEEEGIVDDDAFIAVTDSSEQNILACLTAKEFNVKKTVAQVETVQFISEAENLGIGTIINKKLLASSRIFQMLLDYDTSTAKCLALADAEVAELVAKPDSRITKAMVKDLRLSRDMTIAGLTRDGVGQLVDGNTRIQAGDHVVVFCLNGAIHKVEKLFN